MDSNPRPSDPKSGNERAAAVPQTRIVMPCAVLVQAKGQAGCNPLGTPVSS
jgi:hypothetical protein